MKGYEDLSIEVTWRKEYQHFKCLKGDINPVEEATINVFVPHHPRRAKFQGIDIMDKALLLCTFTTCRKKQQDSLTKGSP